MVRGGSAGTIVGPTINESQARRECQTYGARSTSNIYSSTQQWETVDSYFQESSACTIINKLVQRQSEFESSTSQIGEQPDI